MSERIASILICEDDRLMAEIAEQVLSEGQVELKVVGNGALAIDELKKKTFDLVITDSIMPERSGLEVVSFIRKHQRMDTPILMISGMSELKNIKEAKEKGINDFLAKPFTAEKLKRKVQQLLKMNPFVSRLVL
ncbi:response regulator [Marinilabilia sp.]|uniref:response regulator n=1 Tax=Marinilabilia sp. TaxID=2021252 RepID=UPI0025C2F167|nr:response regulator [Marinilabilia sp.]